MARGISGGRIVLGIARGLARAARDAERAHQRAIREEEREIKRLAREAAQRQKQLNRAEKAEQKAYIKVQKIALLDYQNNGVLAYEERKLQREKLREDIIAKLDKIGGTS